MRTIPLLARVGRALLTAWLLCSLLAPRAHADAGDFQAMPGLWKIVTRTPGTAPHETVTWRCVDEDADPWASFAALTPPDDASCERSAAQRGRTGLAWDLHCPAAGGLRGRIVFDSLEHYTGALATTGGDTVLSVEGRRFAACTSPKD